MKNNAVKPFSKELYRNNKLPILIIILRTLFDTVGTISIAWLLKQIMDLMSGKETGFDLLTLLYIWIGAWVLFLIIHLCDYFSKPKFTTTALKQYTNYSFNKLTNKSVSAFNKEKSSLYISALSNDTSTIEIKYIKAIMDVCQYSLICIAVIGLMIYYSPLLTLISISLAFLPISVSLLTGKKAAKWQKKVSDENENYIGSLQDTINGFSVIKGFKAEKSINKLFRNRMEELSKFKEKKMKIDIIILTLVDLSSVLLQFGVFFVGAYFAIYKHSISPGTVFLFAQLLYYINLAVQHVPSGIVDIKTSKSLMKKMAEALDENVQLDTGE